MTRGLAVAVLGVLLISAATVPRAREHSIAPARPAPAPALRFHHLHYRVGDPAAAVNYAARELAGTRVLLRGLGVGVRLPAYGYVLFDREGAADASEANPPSQEAIYSAAVEWLRAHGVQEPAAGTSRSRIATAFAKERLDHIAFTSQDIPAVVDILRAHGAVPSSRTAESVFFSTGARTVLELARDSDAPDAFWCPMHPDVRSALTGRCPICGMELVAIPPPRIGEYRMDVTVLPLATEAGAAGLRITLRDPISNQPVSGLALTHERLVHLFIVDRALGYFAHVHPERSADGVFTLKHQLPPGAYVLIADFLPLGGTTQMLQRAIVTPGYRGPLFPPTPDLLADRSREVTVDGLRVRLDASGLRAGKEALLRFHVTDAGSGAPVADLEPFLGAAAHMLIVSADLTDAQHSHPEEPATPGPSLSFQPLMPAAGVYKLWVQFQRKGQVITVPFVVTAD
jgi:hypothetical protein